MRHSGANCESIRLGGLVACAAACVGLVLTGMSVYAQGTDKKAAKKPATAPKKSAPAAKKPATAPKKSAPAAKKPASAPKKSAPAAKKPARPSGPPLPLGFVPPPPLPQVMGLNNSLLNAKDELAFRRKGYSAFMKAVRAPGLGSKAQKDIQAGIRW
ncbi:MAG: hypothetical protein VX304_00115, partial [Planctomycetota bacterium]|nr:hypothetical protein [Planctomycetota bacterium]